MIDLAQIYLFSILPNNINKLMDAATKYFYMEMGYSQQQVIKAYEHSQRKKIDILDALSYLSQNNQPQTQSQPQQSLPKKGDSSSSQPKSVPKTNNSSFLTPLSQIRASDYEVLYSRSSKFNALSSKYELREPNNPVGLLNVSNCCYLNSLIQCYFLMDKFKEILLTAQPLENITNILAENKTKLKRVKNQYELLAKLKNFFTLMSLTSKKYLDPSDVLQNLVDSVGEKLTYGEEKDLSEINIMIIERLSEGLTFTKKFFQKNEELPPSNSSFIDQPQSKTKYNSLFNPEKGFIKQLFYGTKVQYYEQQQMQKEQPIVSDFTGIILNPRFGTLQNALDQQFNFSVQIKGEYFKKQMFIREQPEYLFMYINRTEYDRQEQQMMKNDQKFVFDFVLYLDRYLEKYKKERNQKDQKIRKLIHQRNRVKEQISNLQILLKKMEECYHYARGLEGWEQKLPTQEDFQEEENRLKGQLNALQVELKEIQSRKEEYHLMYIFVHRGDAVSGHYWGYGRNGNNWYRFDINCRLIPQEQIIIDMQKSSATPYALLYVKKQNIAQFKYDYHTKTNVVLNKDIFFYSLFEEKQMNEIISENIMLHQQTQIKVNESIKKKCFTDYVNRYNAVKKAIRRLTNPINEKNRLDSVPLTNNFSTFLLSKDQQQLFKFSIFEQSLLIASANRITIDKLMQEKDLLARIQKKFKMKCKGQIHLKNYAIVGKDLQKYLKYQQEYQLTLFQVSWAVVILNQFQAVQGIVQKQLNGKQQVFVAFQWKGALGQSLALVIKYLKVRASFMHSEEYSKTKQQFNEPLYVSQVNHEITKLIMLKLVTYGFKFESLQKFIELTDSSASQIAAINSCNSISLSNLPQVQTSSSIVDQIQQIVRKVNSVNGKKNSVNESASKLQKRPSTKQSDSPLKSVGFSKLGSNQKRPSQPKLLASQGSISLFDSRQTWKIEQLQNAKPNFDFRSKIMHFLKKIGQVVKVYKKAMQLGRALSAKQLKELGIGLNQSRQQQSLI